MSMNTGEQQGGGSKDDGKLDELLKNIQRRCSQAAEVQLHTASDYHYYKSFQEYKQAVNDAATMAQGLLSKCQAATKTSNTPSAPEDWSEAEQVQEWVGFVLDDVLEGVDAALDAHKRGGGAALVPDRLPSGTRATVAIGNRAAPGTHTPASNKGMFRTLMNLARPQDSFSPRVDNSGAPFTHWAPHLAALGAQPPANGAAAPVHPLAARLEELQYPAWQLEVAEPQPPRPLDDTPLVWVDCEEALRDMVAELCQERHVAIDLENHSFRSFHGFTCLMQLSSRTKDWVVDVLALRGAVGPALAPLMADTGVVKVLHGCDHDVVWLQRDFNLYLANVFDTGQAARVLSLPSHSLAHLLQHYAGFAADKRYQLADWRVRPLSKEMLHYARCDTHFLLYIYDRLNQQLAELGQQVPPSLEVPITGGRPSGAVGLVLERSRRLCGALYAHEPRAPAFPAVPPPALAMMRRSEAALSVVQRAAYCALYTWRDTVCREEDEGTGYVLPKAHLLTLSQHMPDSPKALVRLLGRNVSEVAQRRAAELISVMANARAYTLAHPTQMAAALAAAEEGGAAGAADGAAAEAAAGRGEAGVGEDAEGAVGGAVVAPNEMVTVSLVGAGGGAAGAGAGVQAKPVAPLKVKRKGMLGGGRAVKVALTLPQPQALQEQQEEQQPGSAGGGEAGGAVEAGAVGIPSEGAPAPALAPAQAAGAEGDDRVKRVRASFALPFAVMPAAAGQEGEGAAGGREGAAEVAPADGCGEEGEGGAGSAGEEGGVPGGRTTGADVRAAIEQMRAEGGEEEEEGGQGEASAEGEEEEEEGHGRAVQGSAAGVKVLDYIPISLSEMKRQSRERSSTGGGNGGGKGGSASLRITQGTTGKAAIKRKYLTDLEGGEEGEEGAGGRGKRRRQPPPKPRGMREMGSDSEDEGDDSSSEGGDEEGMSEGGEGEQGETGGVQSFDYASAHKAAEIEARKRRREAARAQAELDNFQGRGGRGRGRGRGAQRGGRGGAAPGAGGPRKPAFNPYDIPDANLIKGGKRTSVMPRSGNRSMTFRNN